MLKRITFIQLFQDENFSLVLHFFQVWRNNQLDSGGEMVCLENNISYTYTPLQY